MNSANFVLKAPVVSVAKSPAPADGTAQSRAPSRSPSADCAKNAGSGSDFAGTLSQVHGKPGKKTELCKTHPGVAGGTSLPVAGSGSPPAAVGVPVQPDATSFSDAKADARGTAAPVSSTGAPGVPARNAENPTPGVVEPGARDASVLPAAGANVADGASGAAAKTGTATAIGPAASGAAATGEQAEGDTGTLSATFVAGKTASGPAGPAGSAGPAGPAGPAGSAESAGSARSAGPGSAAAATEASVAGRTSTASEAGDPSASATSAAFANALRSAESDDDGNHADGVDGNASAAAAQGAQAPGQAQINLALAEGSDATGAVAAALQASNSAAADPGAPTAPTPMPATMPGVIVQAPAEGSSSAAPSLSMASPCTPASTGLAGDGSSHAHEGAGDAGTGSGGNGAAALQQLASTPASAPTDPTSAATLRVHAPVDSADFPQGVADRVSFAVDNNWNSAKLQVNPPQLGPIDLQIAVQGDHAQVLMSTHSAVTREALESSLPKLKEMLGAQGFTQVSVDISQRSFQDRSAFNQPYTPAKPASFGPAAAATAPVPASSSAPRGPLGALDAYA
jgi:flagellar hook-length control protein FliK